MYLGRNTSDYLVVDTLMLGACGYLICFGGASLEKCLIIATTLHKPLVLTFCQCTGVLCGGILGNGRKLLGFLVRRLR